MILEKVILSDFRNYLREEITFSPKINYIEGCNAQGKSNLLEAIYLLSTGRSFRTRHLEQLIHHTKESFCIEAFFSEQEIVHSARLSYGKKGRSLQYNQTSYASFLPLLGIFPSILLTPEDIDIITGSPSERRRFLDIHLSQTDPAYIHHLGRYHKAMKQRNALLKQGLEKELAPWEQIMAISGTYLITKREEAVAILQPLIEEKLSFLSQKKEQFSWVYERSYKGFLLEGFTTLRKKELVLGTTLIGPHKDDLLLYIHGKDVKTYCSEGQKRSCIVALKLAEWFRSRALLGKAPLFGVDDFGVHLDEARIFLLQELVEGLEQVFLTAPHFSNLKPSSYTIRILQGSINSSPQNLLV